jgi:hypothetical protein
MSTPNNTTPTSDALASRRPELLSDSSDSSRLLPTSSPLGSIIDERLELEGSIVIVHADNIHQVFERYNTAMDAQRERLVPYDSSREVTPGTPQIVTVDSPALPIPPRLPSTPSPVNDELTQVHERLREAQRKYLELRSKQIEEERKGNTTPTAEQKGKG